MGVLKVGLIGCGRVAQLVHLNILTRLPGAELVALAECDPDRLKEASRRAPAAVTFADYQELLDFPAVDAVVICLPNALHAEATLAALQHGKHVYLEKPLAINPTEGRRVLEAWRRTGLVGMIGFNYRLNPLYQAARQYIQSGSLGELVGACSVFSTAARALPIWKESRQSGGGVLFDLASHHIDLVYYLFGQEVCEVFAGLRSQRSEGDSATLQLRLSDGLLVQSFFSMNAVEDDRFEIFGQAGKLTVDRYLSSKVEISDPKRNFTRIKRLGHGLRSLIHSPYLVEKIRGHSPDPSYRPALANFVTAVRAHQPSGPDFWDGYRGLLVIDAGEKSVRSGRAVSPQHLADEDFAR